MSIEERKRARPTFTNRNNANWGSGAGSKVATSYKTILLGDSNVGKTSIFVRLTQEIFQDGSTCGPTLQMDVARKTFKIGCGRLQDVEGTTT